MCLVLIMNMSKLQVVLQSVQEIVHFPSIR